MPFLSFLRKKNNLASKAASTSHQHLTSWRGDGATDQSNISASLNIRSVCFCYIPTSFSNNPFSDYSHCTFL